MEKKTINLAVACCLTVAACSHLSTNMATNKSDSSPIVSWNILGQDPMLFLKVTAINNKNIGSYDMMAYVDKGPQAIEYSCGVVGRNETPKAGRLTIDAAERTIYFVRGMRKTVTKSWVSKEPLAVTTTVSRGDDGQLHGRLEPVYYDIPKTSSMLLGCEPQVFTCKGYMYVNKSRDSYMCLDKPISSIRMILFRDAAQWTEVF